MMTRRQKSLAIGLGTSLRLFIIRMDQERAILRDMSRWLETSGARK